MTVTILVGDVREKLAERPDESVHCVVTSPPYWGLRDYGVVGQIGLEPDFRDYIATLVAVFREVRRVLRADGTLWLNIGDSYASGGRKSRDPGQSKIHPAFEGEAYCDGLRPADPPGIKPKDLIGIPWMLAFALRADGWWLRQDIIWSKPNPMPESVTDRCTKAHEHLFLLSKSERYYFDAAAIRETAVGTEPGDIDGGAQRLPDGSNANAGRNYRKEKYPGEQGGARHPGTTRIGAKGNSKTFRGGVYTGAMAFDNSAPMERDSHGNAPNETFSRNKRSVWTIATAPYSEAHFATFPPALVEPCILAGCPKGGTVLDPFGGAGTTGLVADRLGRNAVLIELNPEYAAMARRRIVEDAGMFADVAAE